MDMGGEVKVPLVGQVSKKTALYVGGGIVAVAAILVYRKRKAATAAANAGVSSADIDPATGFAYGSAEDQAALAAQGGSITAVGGPGGGTAGTSTPSIPGTGFRTNAEWSQAVISYMVSSGVVTDPGPVGQALGLYLNGRPAGDFRQLIEQAIAIEGLPPVAGPNGFPPAINDTPAPATPTTPTPQSPPSAPATAYAAAGTYLYDWASSQGSSGAALAALNPTQWGNPHFMTWGPRGADGNLPAIAKIGATWKLR